MTQQIKELSAKPKDLSSIPGNHVGEEEDWLPKVVLCFPTHSMTCVCI